MRHRILFRPDDPAAGSGNASPSKDDAGGAPPDPKSGDSGSAGSAAKVEFTPEQQAHIDKLLADRVARAEGEAKRAAQQEAEQAADRAKMDEVDRLKAEKKDAEDRVTDVEKAANTRIVRAEAKLAAVAAGVKPERVEAAVRMLDLSEIAVDDGGEPDAAAIALALQDLKKELPELFGGGSGSAQRSGGDFGGTGGQKRVYTEAEISAMGTEEFAKVQDDVMAAMREGRIKS